ncbi:FGGY-family carbohydrate kinase [Heyndrickxia coagulans]|uniref:FGGY-family carbohydrate kinase n=1 Tax=Heyndrickxia coagulans TaxID=1398 RepID=UPI002DFF23AB|nr:FGGY-family carbohydrate kinase [Heyndrickxia coagulans]MEC5270214.1 FGGY-family carbohydrate kinase [Heyndrickxia coagulans]
MAKESWLQRLHVKPLIARIQIEFLCGINEFIYCNTLHFFLAKNTNTAGAIVKWFKQTLCQFELEAEKHGGRNAYDILNEQASKIPAGSNDLIVLPYFMEERAPIWNSDAKGTIIGLSLAHTKAHLYRAFLEAVAYSLRNAMDATGENVGNAIYIAGGVTKSKVWRQIFADVTGYPVICPLHDVEANMGDVILAGIGTGLLSYGDVKKWQVLDEKILPNPENHEKYNACYQVYQSAYQHVNYPPLINLTV